MSPICFYGSSPTYLVEDRKEEVKSKSVKERQGKKDSMRSR
ncbi:MAG: hypothetical protein ACMUEL_09275 [Flavobacteriales bacterium Tduv]